MAYLQKPFSLLKLLSRSYAAIDEAGKMKPTEIGEMRC
jgi:hypothetical protein